MLLDETEDGMELELDLGKEEEDGEDEGGQGRGRGRGGRGRRGRGGRGGRRTDKAGEQGAGRERPRWKAAHLQQLLVATVDGLQVRLHPKLVVEPVVPCAERNTLQHTTPLEEQGLRGSCRGCMEQL